jgi:hypothetical protein
VITFFGQLLLLASLMNKQRLTSIKLTGLVLLIAAFLILAYYLKEQGTFMVTIVTGIPFLILSAVLTYKHVHSGEVLSEA